MSECILCGGPLGGIAFPYGTRWAEREYNYRACRKCGSKIIDPLPSSVELDAIYSYDKYHSQYYAELESEITPTLLEQLRPLLKDRGRLLDFGCGTGSFLSLAKRLEFRAEGVELDPKTRKIASDNSGCPVSTLDQVRKSRKRYDVIHLGDVLEHLPDPSGTLRALEELMAPDGLFFVEGPIEENRSLVHANSRLFGEIKKRLGLNLLAAGPPTHLSRTDAKSQRRFIERKMGYEIRAFRIVETGWPYLTADDSPGRARSFPSIVRELIGRSAIGLAVLGAPVGLGFGNRFAAIGRPATGRR